jgi:hypothetical protein
VAALDITLTPDELAQLDPLATQAAGAGQNAQVKFT